jgi:PilZ domain-containing protein
MNSSISKQKRRRTLTLDRIIDGSFDMAFGERKSERVDFEQGIRVYMMGIDGTWRRDCLMIDVSQTGARLAVEESLEGLDLKEFFLLLSSTGLAYRRCRMVRLAGDQIGVEFLKQPATKPRKAIREKRKETLE